MRCSGRRQVPPQPTKGGAQDRLWLQGVAIDHGFPLLDLRQRAVALAGRRAEELQPSGAPVEGMDARQDIDELARPAGRVPGKKRGSISTFVGLVSHPSMRSITKNGRSSQAPSVSSQCMRGTGTPCAATASITRNSTSRSVTSKLASGSRRKMNPRLTSRPLSRQRASTDQVSRDAPPGIRYRPETATSGTPSFTVRYSRTRC